MTLSMPPERVALAAPLPGVPSEDAVGVGRRRFARAGFAVAQVVALGVHRLGLRGGKLLFLGLGGGCGSRDVAVGGAPAAQHGDLLALGGDEAADVERIDVGVLG